MMLKASRMGGFFIFLRRNYSGFAGLFFLFSFCLDAKRNKKVKDNPNGSARLSGPRHCTTISFTLRISTHTFLPDIFVLYTIHFFKCSSLIV